jgi:Eukaryotic protein of unknown function (DUF953)
VSHADCLFVKVKTGPQGSRRRLVTTATDDELYSKFEQTIVRGDGDDWVLAIFEGSPEGDAYSWCADCVAASGDVRRFLEEYKGPVKVIQFKVGRKDEWEGRDGGPSPFKAGFPHLSDLPSAVLFHGRLDVARMIAPRKDDLVYLSKRAVAYEEQIKDASWSPPRST